MLVKTETTSKLRSKFSVLASLHADYDEDSSSSARRVGNDNAMYAGNYHKEKIGHRSRQ